MVEFMTTEEVDLLSGEFVETYLKAYLETDGEQGYSWRDGATILLLRTKDRSSSERKTTPLIFRMDGERWVVVASKGGTPENPNWFENLRAEPEAEVQVKAERVPVRAEAASGPERDRLWSFMTEVWPEYEEYQTKTDRLFPIVVLSRR